MNQFFAECFRTLITYQLGKLNFIFLIKTISADLVTFTEEVCNGRLERVGVCFFMKLDERFSTSCKIYGSGGVRCYFHVYLMFSYSFNGSKDTFVMYIIKMFSCVLWKLYAFVCLEDCYVCSVLFSPAFTGIWDCLLPT